MAETLVLEAQNRERTGRKIRQDEQGRIPAILYGHGRESQTLWVSQTPFMRVFEQAGESTIISLRVGGKDVNVLIHAYQIDPLSDEIIHVDFFQVRMDEAVTTDVPLVFVGEAPAVKNDGGTLSTEDSITVRALPGDLPSELTIDISTLKSFDDAISVGDIDIDREKVEVLTADDQTIASVVAPRTQEEVDAAEEDVVEDVSDVASADDESEEDVAEKASDEEAPKA